MDLRTYLDTLPKGGRTKFAARVGLSPIYLSQLAARQDGREPGPECCVRIEQMTDGLVRRWELRQSDWHRIWPELKDAEDAPKLPASADTD